MNRDKLTPIQKVAHEQQSSLLAYAHAQALKQLIENRQTKLSVPNALAYLEIAKTQLSEPEFKEFMFLMNQANNENCDIMNVLAKISNLLQDYPDLIQGFGMFLPPDLNLQLQTGSLFLLNKIKTVVEDESPIKSEDEEASKSPSREDLMETASKEADPILNQNSDDSLDKKNQLLLKEIDDNYAKSFLNKVKERFNDEIHIFQRFLELLESVRKSSGQEDQNQIESIIFQEVGVLFQGHEDLIEEFKTFVPNAVPETQDEEVMDTSEKEPKNSDDSCCQSDTVEVSKISEVNDPSMAAVYKYGSYEEHLFFDKIREAFWHREVYDNFMRVLMLFNENVITRSELLKLATSFLGKFPELLRQFKDLLGFNESGDNIEAIPMKIITLENQRNNTENGADIDFSAGGRNGASYRALPPEFEQPKCSGRTALCNEVLNDTWVSFPSWSEDSTFVTSCKTQFEEMMYRCEDERFELDMAISANAHTLQAVENLSRRVSKMTSEEKSGLSVDQNFGGTSGVLHEKSLHRLYGDKTDELIEGLKRNPLVAIPIVLKRLRVKEEEWKEKEQQFNEIWRNQINSIYLKSLDHQGINFKQNDSKSFRSKNLLEEMEMVYAEKKENNTFNQAHFVLEFKEMEVFLDAIKLILQYLKKLPGIYRDDRRKIELVIRSFIPDFFSAPSIKLEEDMEAEEVKDSLDVENDGEERSAQNSSAGSNRDEGSSDQDELNSNEDNELSDEADKTFIEEIEVFDKMDPLPQTNLPYTLFFASKQWFVFFRQFHILCERLSRLLFESNRIGAHIKEESTEEGDIYIPMIRPKPTYEELIAKLSDLLSGALEYSKFEEEARSLFGIHAYVSFTMDKLILTIVRQLQQVIGDDICKQCAALFSQHTKTVASSGYSSPMEASRVEHEYLRKVDKMMEDERCFKIVWHKKDKVLTIQLLELEIDENYPDPIEAEKWSNYLDAYINEDSCCEELLNEVQQSPVILPRNLRKQLLYWKNKVIQVEKLWQKRQNAKYLKKHLPLSVRKRRALSLIAPMLRKKSRRSSLQEDSINSVNGEEAIIEESEPPTTDNIEIAKEDSNLEAEVIAVNENSEDKVEVPFDEIAVETEIDYCCFEEAVTDISKDDQAEEDSVKSPKSEQNDAAQESDQSQIECNLEMLMAGQECVGIDRLNPPISGSDAIDIETSAEDLGENKHDGSLSAENILEAEEELKSRFNMAVEMAHQVMQTITADNAREHEVITVSDSDSDGKAEDTKQPEKSPERRSVKRRIIRKPCDYSVRTRKNRINQSYMKRRIKRSLQSSKRKRRKHHKRKCEYIEDPTFDFAYFTELQEDEKVSYLALKYVTIEDDVEGAFKKGSYKIYFVQNCDLYVYRKDSLSKARETHQAISEIKTSNFNAWHRVWLDRYVTPAMIKFCNDWFLKSDPEKFKLVRQTISDCTKPPYIPYYKYKVRHYKVIN
ncbi:paired amphipathic helix protein Sin3b-like isoform X1 [Argiope bruennichi]|uniref:paired amphipathic helix protein Sin3b-like isoform X1 n=1 Tax=Argiope bruennichi TaxID=94029 RepID=UPI0024946F21|nr:paired amphipathic helix protein Sin3b-like isoform X1 [Argiope bruennichi]